MPNAPRTKMSRYQKLSGGKHSSTSSPNYCICYYYYYCYYYCYYYYCCYYYYYYYLVVIARAVTSLVVVVVVVVLVLVLSHHAMKHPPNKRMHPQTLDVLFGEGGRGRLLIGGRDYVFLSPKVFLLYTV